VVLSSGVGLWTNIQLSNAAYNIVLPTISNFVSLPQIRLIFHGRIFLLKCSVINHSYAPASRQVKHAILIVRLHNKPPNFGMPEF